MKTEKKKYFPLFTDLSHKKIIVIGGGRVAARRIRSLLDFAGEITVIAPEVLPEIQLLAESGQILWKKKKYEREDICNRDMVLAATDDEMVNDDVYRACKCWGIPVNTASDRDKCDFYFPGLLCEDEVVMGFCGGGNPAKTKEMRRKVERLLHEPGEGKDE